VSKQLSLDVVGPGWTYSTYITWRGFLFRFQVVRIAALTMDASLRNNLEPSTTDSTANSTARVRLYE
jgi:hypothetical protein